jgi:hypothetical protein
MMTRGQEAAWQVARTACANAVGNGNHTIAGPVAQSAGRGRAVGLCVVCGATVEVDLGDPQPEPSGYAVGVRCAPRQGWWHGGAESRLSGLAAAARTDPAFMGYALAAFARGKALTDSWDLAAALYIDRPTLFRLELFPALRDAPAAGGGDDGRATALRDTARDAGIGLSMLTSVLIDARAVLIDEVARAAGQQRARDIETARQEVAAADRALQAARARLASLEAAPRG